MKPHLVRALFLSMSLLASTVWAEDQRFDVNVPAGDLAGAVDTLARQTKLQVLYDPKLLDGKTTPGLQGRYTAREALEKLVEGSGISFHFTAADAAALSSSGAVGEGTKPTELPEVKVTAPPESGYSVPNATTATKTDTPLMETPASVQVIPQQVLQDQKATTLDQALSNVSGARGSNLGWAEYIYLRGFNTFSYLRDGFRIDDPSGLGGLLTLSNVDSIEVLKGPAAILYGRVEPGGVVNLITKQPQATPHYSLEQSFGSWDHYITTVDATGPVNENKTLLYRLIFSYDTSDFWIDNIQNERTFIAPTIQWKPGAHTQVTVETSYSHDQSTLYQQSVVPYDTTTHQFQWGDRSANPVPYYFNPDTLFVGLNWSHEFNDNWSIKQQISHNQVDFSTPLNLSEAFGPLELVGDTWTVGLGTAKLTGKTVTDGTVLDVTGHFPTGFAQHTLLIGGDYYQLKAIYNSRYSNPGGPFVYVPLFSSTVPSTAGIPLDPDTYYYTNTTTKSVGAYLQDQIKLPYHIDILAGFRYQDVWTTGYTTSGANFGGTGAPVDSSIPHENAITPRAGVLWHPKDWVSLYASYTENFGASNASLGPDWQGKLLKPEGAHQYEVGAKTELPDGKASFTIALFDLTKTNVAANDLAHPNGSGGFFPTAIGEVESQGIELTLQGEILPGWDLLAAYTYDHVQVKQGTQTYPSGTAMPFVPDNMFRLFTTYAFNQQPLTGWKIGGGLTWEGSAPGLYVDPVTFASNTSTIQSPGYVIYDAMASYHFNAWLLKTTFQLNINNIFNKSYYTDAFMYVSPWGYVTYGTPRSIVGSVKVEF